MANADSARFDDLIGNLQSVIDQIKGNLLDYMLQLPDFRL